MRHFEPAAARRKDLVAPALSLVHLAYNGGCLLQLLRGRGPRLGSELRRCNLTAFLQQRRRRRLVLAGGGGDLVRADEAKIAGGPVRQVRGARGAEAGARRQLEVRGVRDAAQGLECPVHLLRRARGRSAVPAPRLLPEAPPALPPGAEPIGPQCVEVHGCVRAALQGRRRRAAGLRLQILLLPVRSLQVQAQGQANGSGVAPFPALRRPSPPLLRRYAHQVRLEN